MEHSSSPLWAQSPSQAPLAPASDHRRLGIRVRTSCSAVLQTNGRASHCRAIQMSTSGVILSGGATLELEQRATLHIYLDARRPVTFTVKPVRRIGPLQAFEFVNLRDADRLALAEFLDQRLPH
jgi:hypothetical protein